jgi:hypothetical protein
MINSSLMGKSLTSITGTGNITFHNDDDTKKSADGHALENASGAANNGKETASLIIRGYPLLKAKTTLEITGVGKGSGVWYCKTVVQQWHVDHGYLTNVKLMKDGGNASDSGEGGGGTPIGPAPGKVN